MRNKKNIYIFTSSEYSYLNDPVIDRNKCTSKSDMLRETVSPPRKNILQPMLSLNLICVILSIFGSIKNKAICGGAKIRFPCWNNTPTMMKENV